MGQPDIASDTSVSLIRRARERDPEAWKRIVRLYAPLVFAWCRRAGLSETDAEDVGQEVFAAVHRALDGFRRDRDGDTFRGWLRTITRNKLTDFFRRQATVAKPLDRDILEAWPEDDDSSDVDLGDRGSICRRALDFIRNEFEERTWLAFWRTAVDGQSANDVAEELGMTPVAVRKAKSRVLHRLRVELDELIEFR